METLEVKQRVGGGGGERVWGRMLEGGKRKQEITTAIITRFLHQ